MRIRDALTFDDVLLQPQRSDVVPLDTQTHTRISRTLSVGIPLMSAAMDTVTEAPMAITMAQAGGIGVIHKNLSIEEQALAVLAVKKYESGMVVNPVTIRPSATLADALMLMERHKISGIPVVEPGSDRLVGILTNRDVRFAKDQRQTVAELMTHESLITVTEGCSRDEAERLLHQHRIEKLLVVDGEFRCVGLITVKDIEKAQNHPNATKDDQGRLRVAAATGVGPDGLKRAEALLDAGVDAIIVDTAHGHSEGVLNQVSAVKRLSNAADVIGGNVATADGTKALIDAGADGVKVGIGPGTICTTRIVAGVGVPQLTAVADAVAAAADQDVPTACMVGSLLAGTDEAPGEVFLYQGRSYKSYRGMGSIGAMARGSADRYFQAEVSSELKLVPEGIEGRVPYKGPANSILHQLVGGLRAAMGYTGNADIESMQKNCSFLRITSAGLRESHVHDVSITKDAPNYARSN